MIKELLEKHRLEDMKAVYKFLYTCSREELFTIIEEIRCVHDCLIVFNPNTKSLDSISSVCLNGECIQLNIEKEIE